MKLVVSDGLMLTDKFSGINQSGRQNRILSPAAAGSSRRLSIVWGLKTEIFLRPTSLSQLPRLWTKRKFVFGPQAFCPIFTPQFLFQ